MIEFDIKGAKAVVDTLSKLPRTTQRKVIMPSMRKGMVVVKSAAERNVASVTSGEGTGVLGKSLSVYSLKKYKGNYRVSVQVKRGKVNKKKLINGTPVRVGLYASVLEYGKKGQPPRSWLRKAAKDNGDAVLEVVRGEISRLLPAAVDEAMR